MRRLLLFALLSLTVLPSAAQSLPSIAEKTKNLERRDGYFPIYWDQDGGKIWMEVSRIGEEFLYAVSTPTGLGSNDIGLDRNQLGPQRVVRFDRIGRKLLLTAPNLRFRAQTDNAAEVRATAEAFAEGTVWAFDIAARTGDRFLVEATPFVVRDAAGVIGRLKRSGQGTFKLDPARSAPFPDVLKAFPQNTEMEGRLTFASDEPGAFVRSVAADPTAVSLRVRHSLVQLPDDGYEPRRFDPRAGFGATSFADYAAPIGKDMTVRMINRHRLEKKVPGAAPSEPMEPIIYYLDPGTPEPVRSALLEGGRWWNQAFEAAGFIGGFRMEMLPEDADPLDVRYNVMNWVHRSTRGWSYGSSVTDPRTGEIIKGHVSLGSLRVRQDYLLMEGLLSPYENARADGADDPMLAVALARLRQLSAHEIGHTLGLSHNFASSVNDRASVMDYPAPLVLVDRNNAFDLNQAYARGIGDWDKVTIRYGYASLPDSTDEAEALSTILEEAYASGLRYLTDSDARGSQSAHPIANLWDNGVNPVTALKASMEVRRLALGRFGVFAIQGGQPVATLQEVLVPLYLHHRYQVQAAAKVLGGVTYSYSLRGDSRDLPRAVDVRLQREGRDALLEALDPAFLALPRHLRGGMPPRPPGYGASRELFRGYTDPVFDPYAPAEVGAALVIRELLNPQRLARMMVQADLDKSLPGMSDILADVTNAVWGASVQSDDYLAEIQRIIQQVWIDGLIAAADNPSASPGVRSRLTFHLRSLTGWLAENEGGDYETTAHRSAAYDQIDRYLMRLYEPSRERKAIGAPPGDPIGSGESPLPEVRRMADRAALIDAWTSMACSQD